MRRIRVERRDFNRQLAEWSVQKSLLENNVGEDNDLEEDDEVEEEDAEEVGAADVQELEDDKTEEYHRLHNLLVRTKVDIRTRKEKVENLLKDDSNPLLTDSEKRSNDIKIKAQLRSISEQVNTYKVYNKDIIKICGHAKVETFNYSMLKVIGMANEIIFNMRLQKIFKRR